MRFNVLDALRGLCALAVVVFHIEALGQIADGDLHGIRFIEHSFLFVDFFFVLSGFVLAHSYLSKIAGKADVRAFMLRRFGRVYPLHLLVLMAFVGLELMKLYLYRHGAPANNRPFTGTYPPWAILTNILLIQALGVHDTPTWNTPSWSISVEFYTYLVFALFALIAGNPKIRQSIKLPLLGGICFAIISTSAFIVLNYSKHYMDTIYDYAFFRCLYGFFCGVVAYFLYKRYWGVVKVCFWKSSILEIAASFMVVLFASRTSRVEAASLFAPFIFFVAIMVFSKEEGIISKILRQPPFKLFGRLSYTMYILHAFIIVCLARVLKVLVGKNMIASSLQEYARVNDTPLELLYVQSETMQDVLVLFVIGSVLIGSYFLNKLVEEPWRIYFNNRAAGILKRHEFRKAEK